MNRLKELRQEKKLSQKEIALELQVPPRTYQRWENGESQIKPDKAQALADHFGV
ncbi:helix-turn-helix domain-containing protein, partial [Streptococcus suis]